MAQYQRLPGTTLLLALTIDQSLFLANNLLVERFPSREQFLLWQGFKKGWFFVRQIYGPGCHT